MKNIKEEEALVKLVMNNGKVVNLKCSLEMWQDFIYEELIVCIENDKIFNTDGFNTLEMNIGGNEEISILDCKKVIGICF